MPYLSLAMSSEGVTTGEATTASCSTACKAPDVKYQTGVQEHRCSMAGKATIDLGSSRTAGTIGHGTA